MAVQLTVDKVHNWFVAVQLTVDKVHNWFMAVQLTVDKVHNWFMAVQLTVDKVHNWFVAVQLTVDKVHNWFMAVQLTVDNVHNWFMAVQLAATLRWYSGPIHGSRFVTHWTFEAPNTRVHSTFEVCVTRVHWRCPRGTSWMGPSMARGTKGWRSAALSSSATTMLLIEEHVHLRASSPGYFPPCPLSVSVSVCFQISPDWRTHSSLSIKSRLLPTMSPVCLSLSLSVFRYQWTTAVLTESGLLFLSVPIVNVCEYKYWKNMFWCLSVFLFCLY